MIGRPGNRAGRVMLEAHRRALLDQIEGAAARERFSAIRARALYALAWSSALRLSECLSLDVGDVIDPSKKGSARIVTTFYLPPHKAKGGAAGDVVISRATRDAIRHYVNELLERGLLDFFDPTWRTEALFVAGRGRGAEGGGGRLPKRAAQADFTRWQRLAQIAPPYRWHDLRHTAITRFAELVGGDAYKVASFARHKDVRTSLRYAHASGIAAAANEL